MKETGIIMSGSHPVDILEGRKTMTRRVVNPQPITDEKTIWWHWKKVEFNRIDFKTLMPLYCPYGQVGDRLWVKETWYGIWNEQQQKWECLYKADGHILHNDAHWKASIYMPRKTSRITLEITEIRVERLQEITEKDALAEGCYSDAVVVDTPIGKDYTGLFAMDRFIFLWDSLNSKRGYGWRINPWVWVIEFSRIKQGGEL